MDVPPETNFTPCTKIQLLLESHHQYSVFVCECLPLISFCHQTHQISLCNISALVPIRLSHSSISRAPPTICFDFLRSLLHTYKFLHTAQIDNAAHKHRYFLWFSQFQLPLLNSPVTQLFLLILASVTVCHCWVLSCTWVVLYYLLLNMEHSTLEEHSMQDLCFQWGFTMFTMGQVCTKAPASPLFSFLKKSRTLCRMSGGGPASWSYVAPPLNLSTNLPSDMNTYPPHPYNPKYKQIWSWRM